MGNAPNAAISVMLVRTLPLILIFKTIEEFTQPKTIGGLINLQSGDFIYWGLGR